MSSTQLRTTPDRLRYLVLYEGIGLALVAPLISQLFGQGVAEVGSLAIFFSIVATAWTMAGTCCSTRGCSNFAGAPTSDHWTASCTRLAMRRAL
ncbi:MAG: chlorhexidine efflux transporter [Aeromonas veronii]